MTQSCWTAEFVRLLGLHFNVTQVRLSVKVPYKDKSRLIIFFRITGLGLWGLTPLSTIFQLPVYYDGQFYWWRKPEYPLKTTDLLLLARKIPPTTAPVTIYVQFVLDSRDQLMPIYPRHT
jgi:hypothetical protein